MLQTDPPPYIHTDRPTCEKQYALSSSKGAYKALSSSKGAYKADSHDIG